MKNSIETKMRTLRSGRQVPELMKEFRMTISSKCPDKWLFVDLETGDVWHIAPDAQPKQHPFWRGATAMELRELKRLAAREWIESLKAKHYALEDMREASLKKPVLIMNDGRCNCDCSSPCPLHKAGIADRCTEKELKAAGIKTQRTRGKK